MVIFAGLAQVHKRCGVKLHLSERKMGIMRCLQLPGALFSSRVSFVQLLSPPRQRRPATHISCGLSSTQLQAACLWCDHTASRSMARLLLQPSRIHSMLHQVSKVKQPRGH